MITNLNQCKPESLQNYPFCIIGSGAAGISLAVALIRKGRKVLLLEAGDWKEERELDEFYTGHANAPHPPVNEYRHQRFGGTTHLWGGRCVPMDALDFDYRQHVPNSSWPINYQELFSYYPEALSYCDAGLADFSLRALAPKEISMFDGLQKLQPDLVEKIERYSLPTDFSSKYRLELSTSSLIQVLLRTRCTKLNVAENGSRITSIEVSDGKYALTINAAHFIICGGGIETTRLLLITQQSTPSWSRFEQSLGKYYACHFDLIFGSVRFANQKPFFEFQKTTDGIYARRKLHFSEEFQSQHRLLNSVFRLHFPAYADDRHGSGVLSSIYLAKSLLAKEHQSILNHGINLTLAQNNRLKHLQNVVTDFGSVVNFAYDWMFKMKLAKRKLPYTLVSNRNGSYPLEFNSEQIPDASNKIDLQSVTDQLGMKRVNVNWKLTNIDIDSGIESFKQLQRLLVKTNSARLEFDEGELKERMTSALPVGGHHLGTTRMGISEQNSVVNKNCCVHGVDNLFISSSSVFTTSSHANPTLTIVALSLRLADFLNKISVE
ncbi:GMC oxidoreductase [Methylomonas sp. AM2-LC]|uniref:GMC oxidoreductase n=1 Tax=Methylomonas sp. AM2-LC TaxID=3153301 RepID=UPI003264CED1